MKALLTFLFLIIAIGLPMYYAGKNNLFAYPRLAVWEPKAEKKVRAVKPRSIQHESGTVEPAPANRFQFTFFNTLKDTELVRYVDLNGKIVKKRMHQILDKVEGELGKVSFTLPGKDREPVEPASPSGTKSTRHLSEGKPGLKKVRAGSETRRPARPVVKPTTVKPYAVQAGSFRDEKLARSLERRLREKGYPATVTRLGRSGEDTWYRVYAGRYARLEEARDTVLKVYRDEHLKAFVAKVSS